MTSRIPGYMPWFFTAYAVAVISYCAWYLTGNPGEWPYAVLLGLHIALPMLAWLQYSYHNMLAELHEVLALGPAAVDRPGCNTNTEQAGVGK